MPTLIRDARRRPGHLRLFGRQQPVRDEQSRGRRGRRRGLPAHGPEGHDGRVLQARGCRLRGADGQRQVADNPLRRQRAAGNGQEGRRDPPPDALRRPGQAGCPALCDLRGPRPPRHDDRGTRRVRAAHRSRRRGVRGRRLRGNPAPGRAGSRRDSVGRRQQRPALLQARPAHRRGRPPSRRATSSPTGPAPRTSAWPT